MRTDTTDPVAPDRATRPHPADTPLRRFLRTETGSAVVVLAAAVAALVWANVGPHAYERVWEAKLSIQVGGVGPSHTLRFWVNSGLMSLFFFVVGLEVRREIDVGELRDHRRAVVPIAAGLGGIVVPVGIFLAANAGRPSAHGWGVAMPTDTAFALGMLALTAQAASDRLRIFMLTVSIADDVVALTVIATVYSEHVHLGPLVIGMALLAAAALASLLGVYRCMLCTALGLASWTALAESGVDPILIGTALGLLTPATRPGRVALERVVDLLRRFREEPTPGLAQTARRGLNSAVSPNERLQRVWHPWTSFVIVPLFALANAGIALNGGFLRHAFTSPITLGIVAAGVLGKPVGVIAAAWGAGRSTGGRLRPPVGWAALAGAGAVSGVGFTVSLLIASLVFTGTDLEDAKLGILTATLTASMATWAIFRITSGMSDRHKALALVGPAPALVDLAVPVDAVRDHTRGSPEGLVTVVEYGDFQCPHCGRAEPALRELLSEVGDLRFVWRHLPLTDVHGQAQLAAEAAEAAANQGAFWAMHDRMLDDQSSLRRADVLGHARALGLDLDRFRRDLDRHAGAARIAEDVDGADLSGVFGTPTIFVDGRRHQGHFDVEALSELVRTAQLARLAGRSAT